MDKFKTVIIKSAMSDDADYEWILDGAIHNTIRPYRNWAEDQGVTATFTKHINEKGYGLELEVDVEFDNAQDLAVFNLTHLDHLPKIKMANSTKNWCFE